MNIFVNTFAEKFVTIHSDTILLCARDNNYLCSHFCSLILVITSQVDGKWLENWVICGIIYIIEMEIKFPFIIYALKWLSLGLVMMNFKHSDSCPRIFIFLWHSNIHIFFIFIFILRESNGIARYCLYTFDEHVSSTWMKKREKRGTFFSERKQTTIDRMHWQFLSTSSCIPDMRRS